MDSDFICIGTECMLKAQPIEEDGRRILYFEASNEGVDIQGERVMAKALSESSDHFIKFGNIDIDHYTIIGHKLGLPEPFSYEVGRPIEAKCSGERTFVKAEIYQGGGPLAKNANMLWESVTALTPPARWYPSVGGKVLSKSVDEDPDTGEPSVYVETESLVFDCSRMCRGVAAAGPTPVSQIGSTESQAQTNAMIESINKNVREIVYSLNSKNIN